MQYTCRSFWESPGGEVRYEVDHLGGRIMGTAIFKGQSAASACYFWPGWTTTTPQQEPHTILSMECVLHFTHTHTHTRAQLPLNW